MKYHDYHLVGYEVQDLGETITFRLELPIDGEKTDRSLIEFSGVVFYHFQHTAGAIVPALVEVAAREVVKENREMLTACARQIGVRDWPGDFNAYLEHIESEHLRGWLIESAIGFYGSLVAKSVRQI